MILHSCSLGKSASNKFKIMTQYNPHDERKHLNVNQQF